MKTPGVLLIVLFLSGCTTSYSQQEPIDFNAYWYSGKAEITSFELEQARYGEVHKGTAVTVFVTEPFSYSKQVKLDNAQKAGNDNVSVIKLNLTKKFLTGIYPYSMMSSTFVPVSDDRYPRLLKSTTSSQEWCGHTFMQMNLHGDDYTVKGFSYFESEGDIEATVDDVITEDELWTRIRLNPEALPIGNVRLLPGSFYLRLRHRDIKGQDAMVTLKELGSSEFSDDRHKQYTLEYKDRRLSIYFLPDFPYEIVGWEETHASGWRDAKTLTTKAKRIKTIQSDYWRRNGNIDRKLRDSLGLSTQ